LIQQSQYFALWRLDNTIPTLQQMRKKIQLVRRYSSSSAYAIGRD
jgi:hypothetical protein